MGEESKVSKPTKAFPMVRYAFAIAIVAAIVSVTMLSVGGSRIPVLVSLLAIMIFGLASYLLTRPSVLHLTASALVSGLLWMTVLLIVFFNITIFSSLFLGWPLEWRLTDVTFDLSNFTSRLGAIGGALVTVVLLAKSLNSFLYKRPALKIRLNDKSIILEKSDPDALAKLVKIVDNFEKDGQS